jgi:hypothetical protein
MTDTATPGAVRATAHDAGEQARSVAETGKDEVAKVASEVKTQTSKLVGDAGSKVRERADSQLGAAASMLSDMSGELDRMASNTSPGSSLASLVRDGATMTRQLSDRLQQGGLDGAMRDARLFARRRPVMFLAGAFAVGMMAGRLMRNVDVASVAPSNGDIDTSNESSTKNESSANGSANGSTQGRSGAGPIVTETSVPTHTEDSADIEADWDAPGGRPVTGEPA